MSDSFNAVLIEQADQASSPKMGISDYCTSDGPTCGVVADGWKTSRTDGEDVASFHEGPTARIVSAAVTPVLIEQADQTSSPKMGISDYCTAPLREEGCALPISLTGDRFANAFTDQKHRGFVA